MHALLNIFTSLTGKNDAFGTLFFCCSYSESVSFLFNGKLSIDNSMYINVQWMNFYQSFYCVWKMYFTNPMPFPCATLVSYRLLQWQVTVKKFLSLEVGMQNSNSF